MTVRKCLTQPQLSKKSKNTLDETQQPYAAPPHKTYRGQHNFTSYSTLDCRVSHGSARRLLQMSRRPRRRRKRDLGEPPRLRYQTVAAPLRQPSDAQKNDSFTEVMAAAPGLGTLLTLRHSRTQPLGAGRPGN